MLRTPGTVQLTVRDDGVGFDAAKAAQVFDAFYTTKEDGMGLGLAISRTLVEAHGGKIWAELAHPGAVLNVAVALDCRLPTPTMRPECWSDRRRCGSCWSSTTTKSVRDALQRLLRSVGRQVLKCFRSMRRFSRRPSSRRPQLPDTGHQDAGTGRARFSTPACRGRRFSAHYFRQRPWRYSHVRARHEGRGD